MANIQWARATMGITDDVAESLGKKATGASWVRKAMGVTDESVESMIKKNNYAEGAMLRKQLGEAGFGDGEAPIMIESFMKDAAPGHQYRGYGNDTGWVDDLYRQKGRAAAPMDAPAQAPRPDGYQSKWNPEANDFQRRMFEKEQIKAGVAIEQKAAAKNLLGNSYPSRDAKVNPLNGLPMSSSALPVDDVLKNASARAKANPAVKEAAQAFINPPKPPEIPGVGGASRTVGSVPRKVAGGLITAWMVQSMFGSRGEQSNAELYNQ